MSIDAKTCQHKGRALRCPIWAGDRFDVREYALRTLEDEMFKQTWAADQVKAYVCAECGNITWFV
jgi:hypothetical protein